jgi:cephalosporin hydroxylase
MAGMSYRDIQGWMNFEDIYLDAVAEAPVGGVLVEVGVNMGRSLAFLARAAIDRGRTDLQIYGVDNWAGPASTDDASYTRLLARHEGDAWKAFNWSMETHAPEELRRVQVLRHDSADAAVVVPAPWFVFIDADHSYAGCKRDIEAWRKVVVAGGIMSGHDYPHEPVAQAVREAFGCVPQRGTSWWIRL